MTDPSQQRLFEHYNPLDERMGSDFFDALPKKTGIYKMFGRDGNLLYVGKAKNLRNRLFTYRRAEVGRVSRKTVRLIRMVRNIEYELCDDEKEALLRENELIREFRPPFNRAKKSPETYYFIHLKRDKREYLVKLDMNSAAGEGEWLTYGAFKGHRLVRRALGALLRLLYIAEYSVKTVHKLPPVLLKNLTPMKYRLPLAGDQPAVELSLLDSLFKGSSEQFFERYTEIIRQKNLLDKYIGKLILEEMEAARQFYEKCCRRNFEIVEQLQLDAHLIPQEKLDDYLVELAL